MLNFGKVNIGSLNLNGISLSKLKENLSLDRLQEEQEELEKKSQIISADDVVNEAQQVALQDLDEYVLQLEKQETANELTQSHKSDEESLLVEKHKAEPEGDHEQGENTTISSQQLLSDDELSLLKNQAPFFSLNSSTIARHFLAFSFCFSYGFISLSYILIVLPSDLTSMRADSHLRLVIFGIICSALIAPIFELCSNRCLSSFGKRRPYLCFLALTLFWCLVLIWACKVYNWPEIYCCCAVLAFVCLEGISVVSNILLREQRWIQKGESFIHLTRNFLVCGRILGCLTCYLMSSSNHQIYFPYGVLIMISLVGTCCSCYEEPHASCHNPMSISEWCCEFSKCTNTGEPSEVEIRNSRFWLLYYSFLYLNFFLAGFILQLYFIGEYKVSNSRSVIYKDVGLFLTCFFVAMFSPSMLIYLFRKQGDRQILMDQKLASVSIALFFLCLVFFQVKNFLVASLFGGISLGFASMLTSSLFSNRDTNYDPLKAKSIGSFIGGFTMIFLSVAVDVSNSLYSTISRLIFCEICILFLGYAFVGFQIWNNRNN